MNKKQLLAMFLAVGLTVPAISVTSAQCLSVATGIINQANNQRASGQISLADYLEIYQMAMDYLNDCMSRTQAI